MMRKKKRTRERERVGERVKRQKEINKERK